MNFTGAASSVLGREAMRELDARTIASGTPSLELMERAGRAIADALADPAFHGVPLPERPRLLVLAGRGNNGGDGFVVARLLASERWRCTVALVDGEPAEGGDADRNLDEWQRIGGRILEADQVVAALTSGAADYDLALDAIFGTGLVRPVEGSVASFIQLLNQSGLPVVAADVPSGLDADTGTPLGVAVRARATVTIGAAKPGLFLDDGPDHAGRVRVADIGLLTPFDLGLPRQGVVLDERSTAGAWPRLSPLSHKGSRGHVLVVAGSPGKTGAAVLAARGALRAGAGLVTVASVPEVQQVVATALPEAMTLALDPGPDGREAAELLRENGERFDAIVAGPGHGVSPAAHAVIEALLGIPRPVVLDADGLNVVAAWKQDRRRAVFGARTTESMPKAILTPHPGEMGRLVATSNTRVQLKRKLFADNLAHELGCIVVLKGAATIVSDGVVTAFNTSGNPGMAAAGMGDVLAGVCGALAARLASPLEAASLAVWVHGVSGDRLQASSGTGFLAGEVADGLPPVLKARRPR